MTRDELVGQVKSQLDGSVPLITMSHVGQIIDMALAELGATFVDQQITFRQKRRGKR